MPAACRRPHRRHSALLIAAATVAVLAAGCTSGAGRPSTSGTTDGAQPATGAASTTAPGGGGAPIWLCRPGTSPDPCAAGLAAKVETASGAVSTEVAPASSAAPAYDCFYVYPTVSSEPGPNADLRIQPAETEVAVAQASRFSSVCRVWAPMYHQVTVSALFTGGLPALDAAYASLASDWDWYLRHENGGRPVVLIGHSQGAAMLIRLIADRIDPDPAVRRQLVVAILAGGNLQVPPGRTVGATFEHIPLCTSTATDGCAIAYSTFGSPPPAGALFGRPGAGVSLMSLQLTSAGQQVACVNPASLSGGTAPLIPYFPQPGPVAWVTYPGLYQATCRSAGGATWLQVDTARAPGDARPTITAVLGPNWGYHAVDVNLALGNLVSDVAALERVHRT